MRKIALVLLGFTISLLSFSQKTYIWCGTLIDGVSDAPRKSMTIIVEGNKILAVESGYSKPGANDKSIDLKNRTVTPGWLDMHVHMEHETNPDRYIQTYTFNPADYAFQSVRYSEITLMTGFTTVRDLGVQGSISPCEMRSIRVGSRVPGSIQRGNPSPRPEAMRTPPMDIGKTSRVTRDQRKV